jgi:hypothetical protein
VSLSGVRNTLGDDISGAVENAALANDLDPVWLLALIQAESGLNPRAERWGRRTQEAQEAIQANDDGALQAVIDTQWPDISFGYSQRIVLYHELGDRQPTADNCRSVRDQVFADPESDIQAAARRLAGCKNHPSFDGETALSAMVIYNAGSDRRDDAQWYKSWYGNVQNYQRAIDWATAAAAASSAPPALPEEFAPEAAGSAAGPSADLQNALNVIWGWSEQLEAGTPTDRARAGQQLKDSAIAIKNALGLNG